MKPKPYKTILKRLFRFICRKPVKLAENLQHHKQPGRQRKLFRDMLKEAGVLDALGRPAENVTAALVACDAGDPSMLHELVKKGYVVGSIESARKVFHELQLRDASFFGKPILKREECHNEEIERVEEIHNVGEMDALDQDADGWFKISPYGVYEGKTPGRLQHFGMADAQRMESHFNSLSGKLGRLFRGCPIFIGHPDVDRTIWTDERRLGKLVAVQARQDGLWGKTEWNKLGRENVENGYWIYPSPRWDGPAGQMEFHPDRLLSIGLTNNPRIKTSEPIANAEFAETIDKMRKGTHEQQSQDNNHSQQTEIMDRKLMIEKLGLPPEATDEEIWAKLEAILKENADMAAAEKMKLDAEQKKQDDTAAAGSATGDRGDGEDDDDEDEEDDELKKARTDLANARVDLAIAEGRIGLADRDTWLGRLTGENRETEYNSLTALKPKLNTGVLDLQKARAEVGDEAQRRETIANAVAEKQKSGLSYADAYAAVRKDPQYKATFDAMKEPGRED